MSADAANMITAEGLKELEAELDEVVRGQFDFARHYHLLLDDETEE